MPQRICAASKAGPGGRGGREQALDVAERDLAVRADVDEQPQALVARHARGQQARDDVAADVGAERREDVRVARAGARVTPKSVGAHQRVARGGHDERRHADRLGIDAEQRAASSSRCRRARPRRPRRARRSPCSQHLGDEVGERAPARGPAASAEHRRVHHRGRDAADDVGAVGLLAVEDRAHGDGRAGREVEQRRDDRRRAEVERDAEHARRSCRRPRRRSARRRRRRP